MKINFDKLIIIPGLLATNGVVASARIGSSAVLLGAVGSADEKLLKDVSNYKTQVNICKMSINCMHSMIYKVCVANY